MQRIVSSCEIYWVQSVNFMRIKLTSPFSQILEVLSVSDADEDGALNYGKLFYLIPTQSFNYCHLLKFRSNHILLISEEFVHFLRAEKVKDYDDDLEYSTSELQMWRSVVTQN